MADPEGELCGICLRDESEFERGKLNCCDHRFCVECIAEWSKIESRCPLCKQRFTTITKPARPGRRQNVVRVPRRNQAYAPSEEEIRAFANDATVVCSECFESGEDSTILLCDGCDAAAHTTCVGLDDVPLHSWFCARCVGRELDKVETQMETEIENYSPKYLDFTPFARTLSSQREVRQRVQHFLREHWEEFRTGALEFSLVQSERPEAHQEEEPESVVAKAWKMMEGAKRQACEPSAAKPKNSSFKRPSLRSRASSSQPTKQTTTQEVSRTTTKENRNIWPKPSAGGRSAATEPTAGTCATTELLKRRQEDNVEVGAQSKRSRGEESSSLVKDRRAAKEALLEIVQPILKPHYARKTIDKEVYKCVAREAVQMLLSKSQGLETGDLKSEARQAVERLLRQRELKLYT